MSLKLPKGRVIIIRMKIGYARVSTNEQNIDLQIDTLKAAGCRRYLLTMASAALQKNAKVFQMLSPKWKRETTH